MCVRACVRVVTFLDPRGIIERDIKSNYGIIQSDIKSNCLRITTSERRVRCLSFFPSSLSFLPFLFLSSCLSVRLSDSVVYFYVSLR